MVEAIKIPYTPLLKTSAAAIAQKQADIDTAFDDMIDLARGDWIRVGEDPAYLDGKASYDALAQSICAKARTAGWAKTNACPVCAP